MTENQHKSGSYAASPNFSVYNYCWLRDGSFTAYSMDLWKRFDSSESFFEWTSNVISNQSSKLKKIIQMKKKGEILINDDYLPTRFKLDGSECGDEWPSFQLDGYGTWLWALSQHIKITKNTALLNKYNKSIKIAIDYLTDFWMDPSFDCWQENGERIHTLTLAAIYGGLKSINEFLSDENVENTKFAIKQYVIKNCIVNGRLKKCVDMDSIDSSLIWAAVPYELFDINSSEFLKTIEEIENSLVHNCGVHRYPEDTYYGGGEWIILSASLGLYYCKAKKIEKAESMLNWIESKANENGELPEQSLENVNNENYINVWESLWGKVASPVLWSHAMYLILLHNIENYIKD
ncbi:glycoside hydrolase family 15 protein [Clostridium sp. JN-9]|uniref:glycoside hydrolase family 15 protein n=1 Tax=Clostridium sp. JN-9 TaxID=2507159 RepID=UPI001FAB01BB|nr:glycoside hydrolase family 15 protein [Clostridium sp. JN-9]